LAAGKVIDPVCRREVNADAINEHVGKVAGGAGQTDPGHGTKWFHDGRWIYFCSVDCRRQFMAEPARFMKEES
jgi:YHS domain-containing protein